MKQTKLLLTSVFGPYGIKNKYAEGLGMQMESMNNQITREQGVHSPRQNHISYCLYLLAENISVDSVVLDFPSWHMFKRELNNGYTHVAISFIDPNILKVKRMTEYIRKHYPSIKIILGGPGTIVPEIKDIVRYDDICFGEGVRWLRNYFGDNPDEPIKHPLLDGCGYAYLYGYRTKAVDPIILTGVGCKKACDFCITSARFQHQYIPLLKSGKEIYDVCIEYEEKMGVHSFGIMDENFFIHPDLARELLMELEKNNKLYNFYTFASVDRISELGVDFLQRLGIRRIWVGVESEKGIYSKTKNIDVPALCKELQSKGISVIASAILFLDHHDRESIYQDINWVISLGTDMVQFMNYTPLPGTMLYKKLKEEGRLLNIPYRYITGAGNPGFEHKYFKSSDDFEKILRSAFKKKYESDGPSVLNMSITAIKGYLSCKEDFEKRQELGLVWDSETIRYVKSDNLKEDEYMKQRVEILRKVAKKMRTILIPAKIFSPNAKIKRKVQETIGLYENVFGKPSLHELLRSYFIVFCGFIECFRIFLSKFIGRDCLVRQPKTMRKEYIKEQ